MARDLFSLLVGGAFVMAGVMVATHLLKKSMKADDEVSQTIPNPSGGWPYVVTEPTEQNMLLQNHWLTHPYNCKPQKILHYIFEILRSPQ